MMYFLGLLFSSAAGLFSAYHDLPVDVWLPLYLLSAAAGVCTWWGVG